ncbi:uncharacterized protein BJX67DRAFT_5832 [Aspergillus lucknowensis]|uniref:Uncharacterized protein n=1 Tax=Aspergillus lucknowensis TaxID=176173 RepID=A0ABR4M6Z7_9EURO
MRSKISGTFRGLRLGSGSFFRPLTVRQAGQISAPVQSSAHVQAESFPAAPISMHRLPNADRLLLERLANHYPALRHGVRLLHSTRRGFQGCPPTKSRHGTTAESGKRSSALLPSRAPHRSKARVGVDTSQRGTPLFAGMLAGSRIMRCFTLSLKDGQSDGVGFSSPRCRVNTAQSLMIIPNVENRGKTATRGRRRCNTPSCCTEHAASYLGMLLRSQHLRVRDFKLPSEPSS